jgi:lipopolysaccharide transport system ATP-binding protein
LVIWAKLDDTAKSVEVRYNNCCIKLTSYMTDIAIRVQNLSKCHHIYDAPRDRLKQFVVPPLQRLIRQVPKQYFHEFWALKGVSFEIKKGDAFGIIGRNGSGKSTLLQMICGTLNPTAGSIQTNGRIAALLELGSGFNPDFTGRENIYLNGSILGLTGKEIDARLDDILAFADIGDFIDQPVKTYSSGMFVRLAFAIQVNVDPEILIVDEALSVGDFFFQQKCFARIRKMRENGLTLLFVSHDMGTVRDLCPNSVYLIKGKAAFIGESQKAIRTYLSESVTSASVAQPTQASVALEEPTIEPETLLEEAMQVALWRRESDNLNNDHRLLAVVVRDENGVPVTAVRIGRKLTFQIFFRTKPDDAGHVSLVLKNKYDQIVNSTGSYFIGMEPLSTKGCSYGVFELEIECMLETGFYSFLVSYGLPIAHNRGELLDQTDWLGPLQINWDYESQKAPFLGMFGLPVKSHVVFK